MIEAIYLHGYSILFAVVFCESVGLPVPAALALIVSGALCATGKLNLALAGPGALASLVVGDTLMYLLGRHTGWWFLGILCRLSLNPESCILRSADSFYKRGRMVLVFAKFIPGINSMAPPLAGSMNMRYTQFLPLDFLGATLYAGVYLVIGFAFSGFLGAITAGYEKVGDYIGWVILFLIALYIGYLALLWLRSRKLAPVRRVRAHEISGKLDQMSFFDARSHGYYEKGTMRIQGSRRLEPNGLNQTLPELPQDREIVLYCTCIREATSIRAARVLSARGHSVSVLTGGLRAWRKAGLPVEAVPDDEVVPLPAFN